MTALDQASAAAMRDVFDRFRIHEALGVKCDRGSHGVIDHADRGKIVWLFTGTSAECQKWIDTKAAEAANAATKERADTLLAAVEYALNECDGCEGFYWLQGWVEDDQECKDELDAWRVSLPAPPKEAV